LGLLKFLFAMLVIMLGIFVIGRVLDNSWVILASTPAALLIVGLSSTFAGSAKPPP
jgi:hypothetical protein